MNITIFVKINLKKMKKLLIITAVFVSVTSFAQDRPTTEISNKNSWLKLGIDAGVPTGDMSNVSSFVLGGTIKGQLMETKNLGIGLTTGYNHFFAKDNFKSIGTIPVGAFVRYYPTSNGFFAGLDLGYSFITNSTTNGGFYLKPELGYHNYDWNFFGFYNHIFVSNSGVTGNVAHLGVGATYNLRFK
jgi:hypothetical protein